MKINVYKFYKDKYNLENLNLKISNKKIMFLIYDDEFKYLLNDNIIFENEKFDMLEKINELNNKYKLEITNFYPVCFCSNTLIIALKTNILTQDSELIKYKRLIQYHKKNYSTLFVSSNIKQEINMSLKYINRYKFHEKVLKKYILTEKRRRKQEFKNLLYNILPNKESIIDVSCGDNSDIFLIAEKKKYKMIVGNDICLNYLNLNKQDNVIYTNDDVEANNVKEDSYDVSFCKNTLHHMNNVTNINNMLNYLDKISKKIIIIEILNPKDYKGLPRILNKYLYTKFLKDVGNCYLNENQFIDIINSKFKKHKIEYNTFTNILGTYKIAIITRMIDINENRN